MRMRLLLLLPCTLACVACGPSRAEPGMVLDRLYFGLSSPAGEVSDARFDEFLAAEVTPRFPDGLTRYEARGQWRGKSGEVARERSVVVELAFPDTPANRAGIDAIVAAYRARFDQESVMVVEEHPDVRF
jgi:hypothetical protein